MESMIALDPFSPPTLGRAPGHAGRPGRCCCQRGLRACAWRHPRHAHPTASSPPVTARRNADKPTAIAGARWPLQAGPQAAPSRRLLAAGASGFALVGVLAGPAMVRRPPSLHRAWTGKPPNPAAWALTVDAGLVLPDRWARASVHATGLGRRVPLR